MAITNNKSLVNTFDSDRLVANARVLATDASQEREWAAQCYAVEIVREILATGITLAEWNAPDPWTFKGQTWEEYWSAIQSRGFARACLNVSPDKLPHLTDSERDQAANLASNLFEHGYIVIMSGTSNNDKITFTRTGGV